MRPVFRRIASPFAGASHMIRARLTFVILGLMLAVPACHRPASPDDKEPTKKSDPSANLKPAPEAPAKPAIPPIAIGGTTWSGKIKYPHEPNEHQLFLAFRPDGTITMGASQARWVQTG